MVKENTINSGCQKIIVNSKMTIQRKVELTVKIPAAVFAVSCFMTN